MEIMKTIMYTTDCSEHSITALHYAYNLSSKLKTELIVLHVFDIPSFPGTTMIRSMREMERNAYEEQRGVLRSYCEKNLDDNLENLNIRIEAVKSLSVTEAILRKIKEMAIEMVIIGMKNEHSQRGFLSGDIAKELIVRSSCPVLVVPSNFESEYLKNIVYATDFEESDIWAIERLTEVAHAFKSKINVIHISTKDDEEEKSKMAWFKEMVLQKINYKNISFDLVISDNIYENLKIYLDDIKADLVVLLEREGRGFINKLFHRDLVKQVESHTDIPLLSFNKGVL